MTPFSRLVAEDQRELLEHMLEKTILHRDGARLSLGAEGKRRYAFRNFSELYAVFATPDTLAVVWGGDEVGRVESQFLMQEEEGQQLFTLGGRAWV